MPEDGDKRVIGLYGEMCLAMQLHERGWQVYRAYIDENIDFVLCKCYCTSCNSLAQPEQRAKPGKGAARFPTNLCATCKRELIYIVRFVQAKTSEGIEGRTDDERQYSFHAKLRSNIDSRAFYAWIALTDDGEGELHKPHFYIFHHSDIAQFDDLSLDSYQRTDNQKTTLRINREGEVLNQGRKHNFDCFRHFHDNFDALDEIRREIDVPSRHRRQRA